MTFAPPAAWKNLPDHVRRAAIARLATVNHYERLTANARAGERCRIARTLVRALREQDPARPISYNSLERWLSMCYRGRVGELAGKAWWRRCGGQAVAVEGRPIAAMNLSQLAAVTAAIAERQGVLASKGNCLEKESPYA